MIELLNSNDFDNEYFEDFKDEFNSLFEDIFKDGRTIVVEASNSNWRGQTGYKEVKDTDELLSTVLDGNHFESCRIGYSDDNEIIKECRIISSGHDTPTGCSIALCSVKDKDIDVYGIYNIPCEKFKVIIYDKNKRKFKISRLTASGYYKRLNTKTKQ